MQTCWDHWFSTDAKFSEELSFFTPGYAYVLVPIGEGYEMLIIRKIVLT